MTRPTSTVNVVRALALMAERPVTKPEIAQELCVSERTVKRYIRAIREAGVLVRVAHESGGSVRGESYNLPTKYRVIL